jgi:hypothetical protein
VIPAAVILLAGALNSPPCARIDQLQPAQYTVIEGTAALRDGSTETPVLVLGFRNNTTCSLSVPVGAAWELLPDHKGLRWTYEGSGFQINVVDAYGRETVSRACTGPGALLGPGQSLRVPVPRKLFESHPAVVLPFTYTWERQARHGLVVRRTDDVAIAVSDLGVLSISDFRTSWAQMSEAPGATPGPDCEDRFGRLLRVKVRAHRQGARLTAVNAGTCTLTVSVDSLPFRWDSKPHASAEAVLVPGAGHEFEVTARQLVFDALDSREFQLRIPFRYEWDGMIGGGVGYASQYIVIADDVFPESARRTLSRETGR